MGLVHWHRHSAFSLLDGTGTPLQYAHRAAELGQPALAQTDHGTLSGALHHIRACTDPKIGAGIVPITGVEAYFRPNRLTKITREAWHLCLFAKNLTGWHNLLRLVSTAFAETDDGGGFYQYPCIDRQLIEKYCEGLMCSTACVSSWLSRLIQGGDSVATSDYLNWLKSCFGDDLFLEIMPHDFDDQRTNNLEIVGLGTEHSIPLLATSDAHAPYKEWAKTQSVAKMVSIKMTMEKYYEGLEMEPPDSEDDSKEAKKKRSFLRQVDLVAPHETTFLASENEMAEQFSEFHPDLPEAAWREAIDNTMLPLSRIKPFVLDKSSKLPNVRKRMGDAETLLRQWIQEGLEKLLDRWQEKEDTSWINERFAEYEDRVEYEFGILKSKGVLDYFIIVGDMVRWAKQEGIRVGLGRGSAAGSLVSYLIGITAIDPMTYGLLFERFLNPDRKGLPDIDVDFDPDKRSVVKQHLVDTWGQDHVADIITFTTFKPRNVLQAVSKVFGVPYLETKEVTDSIDIHPDDEETTLEQIRPLNKKLDVYADRYPEVWEICLNLEGTNSNTGKHAGGVVITPEPIIEYMPLDRGKKGDLVTSWSDAADFQIISDYGLVKIDVLGVEGLKRHEHACQMILRDTGEWVDLNELPALRDPYDVDPKVMEIFQKGLTLGVYQFGKPHVRQLLKRVQPTSIHDLSVINAINRPGAIDIADEYVKRKHMDPDEIPYWHELVKPFLEESAGLIVYQEQVMQMVQVLGGMTPGVADFMRKAMGKLYRLPGDKAKQEMQVYWDQWVAGCKAHGIPLDIAKDIWEKIIAFGSYGFNKSHAESYAVQAYQDAWLKCYYWPYFDAALLSDLPSNLKATEKKSFSQALIREARNQDIEILPPSVHDSDTGWTVKDHKLLFGLTGIEDVGEAGAKTVIAHRPYKSLEDFNARVPAKSCNAKVRTALSEAGAFDCWGVRDEMSGEQIAAFEKKRLNLSLTVSADTQRYAHILRENIYTPEEIEEMDDGEEVIIGGEVTSVTRRTTKRGNPFCFSQIAFEDHEWRCTFWTEALYEYGDFLVEGSVIMVSGRKDTWKGQVSVVANFATSVQSLAQEEESVAA